MDSNGEPQQNRKILKLMNNSESVTNLENRMLENIGILDLYTMIKKWNF